MNKDTLKEIRPAYGFDEVAIAPGDLTVNPDMVDIGTEIGGIKLDIPFMASAMDSVMDPNFAVSISGFGGLGVLNLDGLHTRYEDVGSVYKEIAAASREEAPELMQKIYAEPVKERLIGEKIEQIRAKGGRVAVSVIPANTKRTAPIADEAGAELIVIQSTVTTVRHKSRSPRGLILKELIEQIKAPIAVGNTVSYDVTLELFRQGVKAVLVGVGPGAACTSREVLGIGVPQITATIDCAAAKRTFHKETGEYRPIITDGGFRTGGDVCKAFVSGADAVMIGSPFSKTEEAPAHGFHWGMATPHSSLPRGTRISLGTSYSLKKLLFGPSSKTDGTENLVGSLKTAMGMVGASNVREMQEARLVYAPAIKSEGKIYQLSGLGL